MAAGAAALMLAAAAVAAVAAAGLAAATQQPRRRMSFQSIHSGFVCQWTAAAQCGFVRVCHSFAHNLLKALAQA